MSHGDSDFTDRAFSSASPFGMKDQDTFSGALSFLRRKYSKDLTDADVVVCGVPYDLAVTNRPGTRFGPRAIRMASSQLAWPGGPWRWGFDPTERLRITDWGDMSFDFGHPEGIPAEIEAHTARMIASGAKVLTLGGDHFITYPVLKAHAAKHGPLALLQFDSHSDTWREDGKRIDHGTMFFHGLQEGVIDAAHSVQIGIRSGNPETHGMTVLDADYMIETPVDRIVAKIEEVTAGRPVYLTFDIDCLDPAFAPGTGTPVWGGLTSAQASIMLRDIAGINMVGGDVVEVSPPFDTTGATAIAGAHVAMELICLLGWNRR